jgi:hypothetical protein
MGNDSSSEFAPPIIAFGATVVFFTTAVSLDLLRTDQSRQLMGLFEIGFVPYRNFPATKPSQLQLFRWFIGIVFGISTVYYGFAVLSMVHNITDGVSKHPGMYFYAFVNIVAGAFAAWNQTQFIFSRMLNRAQYAKPAVLILCVCGQSGFVIGHILFATQITRIGISERQQHDVLIAGHVTCGVIFVTNFLRALFLLWAGWDVDKFEAMWFAPAYTDEDLFEAARMLNEGKLPSDVSGGKCPAPTLWLEPIKPADAAPTSVAAADATAPTSVAPSAAAAAA